MHLQLKGLGKRYTSEEWAVQDLELEIPSASICGFIGPNGAGKSTTLRMLATVLRPSQGSILFNGEALGKNPSALRSRIGFLGDGNPLYRELSPAEYLRFYGECFFLSGAKLERQIDKTLESVSLQGKRDVPSAELSKGMRQRLLIARCLIHEPELLILDEPADGLDPMGRSDLRQILQGLRDDGMTILLSSHILREMDELCDYAAIIQAGKLKAHGPIAQLLRDYDIDQLDYRLEYFGAEHHVFECLDPCVLRGSDGLFPSSAGVDQWD